MGKPTRKLTPYNKCMSRQLKGKMKGKTKAQRAAMFKAAAKRCSKNPSRKSPASSKPKSRASAAGRSNPTGGTRRVTTFNTQKMYGLIRKGAVVLPAAMIIMGPGTTEAKANHLSRAYMGYDFVTKTFKWEYLLQGYMPAIGAAVMTTVVPKIGSFIRGLLK